MTLWQENPAAVIERVFGDIAQKNMADFPLANPALTVEAVAYRRYAPAGSAAAWLGVLIAPWAMNLMLLPAPEGDAPWPNVLPGEKYRWRFPSGTYEFTVATADGLGLYHLCSLFSPPLDFPNQTLARQTAYAILAALLQGAEPALEPIGKVEEIGRRRDFLGLLGKRT
jgi:[NiFe] hydrogenase assembly HybE family chaperone